MATYILQKDLPDLKAGAEFTQNFHNGDYFNKTQSVEDKIKNSSIYQSFCYSPVIVENNPEWFKLKEEKTKESNPTLKDLEKVIQILTGLKDFEFALYTEEDMRNCWNASRERKDLLSNELLNKNFKDYLNSLRK